MKIDEIVKQIVKQIENNQVSLEKFKNIGEKYLSLKINNS